MINRVILVGRLTQDPQMRKTNTGRSVCSFTLAVSRPKRQNSTTQEADFINCVAWEKTAELMCSYLRKGSQIGVEGRIQTRNYDDPNVPNRKVYVKFKDRIYTVEYLNNIDEANVELELQCKRVTK